MSSNITEIYKLHKPPKEVCSFTPFDNWDVRLTKWPSRWKRFWMYVFFGWKFKPIG